MVEFFTSIFGPEAGPLLSQIIGTLLAIVLTLVLNLLRQRLDLAKLGDRYGLLFEFVTDAVYRAEVERRNGNLDDYADEEAETGRDRRLLFVIDLAQEWADKNLKWKIDADMIATIVESVVAQAGLSHGTQNKE